MKRWILFAGSTALFASLAGAQQYQRRATITGGGDRDHGKCTIEVVVDGAAEIDIRGDQGTIRNLSGQPAQWRRFECTSAMPPNAANFRFAGVDGRGRQELLRAPDGGGTAVIRIEDPQGGSEGYTFDMTWGGNFSYPGPVTRGPDQRYPDQRGAEQRPPDQRYPERIAPDDRYRGGNRRFTAEQAVNVCQDSVRRQALTTYRGRDIQFRETRLDDQPGRNDWVVGMVDIMRRGNAPEQRMRFSCSVNFDTGQVRSVDLQPVGDRFRGGSDRVGTQRAIDSCQQAVRSRILRDGDARLEFTSIRMDDNPGRNDWVIGSVRADRGRGFDSFNFSCSVNLRDGDVRSVDVTRR
jgi:hypothetical protein